MTLFKSLDPKQKSPQENWEILNRLERKITIRRADAAVTLLIGQFALLAYAILAVYGMLVPYFLTYVVGVENISKAFGPLLSKSLFDYIPLPWYAVVLIVIAGAFVVPWLISLLAKGITVLIASFAVKEKTDPLPSDEAKRAKALTERTRDLCGKQYKSNGPDTGVVPTYIASVAFGLIPFIVLLVNDTTRTLIEKSMIEDLGMEGVIGWIIGIAIILIFLGILSVAFWFVSAVLSLGFDFIHAPLYRGRHWYPRYEVLLEAGNVFYEQWVAVDPEERARQEERLQQLQAESEKQACEHNSYIETMARVYARERKENEEYLKRLHDWATNGDDPTPGCGDGI